MSAFARYGQEGSGLTLDLVYNPVGATLPPSQGALEPAYKVRGQGKTALASRGSALACRDSVRVFGASVLASRVARPVQSLHGAFSPWPEAPGWWHVQALGRWRREGGPPLAGASTRMLGTSGCFITWVCCARLVPVRGLCALQSELVSCYGILFNSLLTITNMPINRSGTTPRTTNQGPAPCEATQCSSMPASFPVLYGGLQL